MASVILKGITTPDGQLEVDLPTDFVPGPVEIEIRQSSVLGTSLGELLQSGLVGLWETRADIEDSVDFAGRLRQGVSQRNTEHPTSST
jgi:hypothetical protein